MNTGGLTLTEMLVTIALLALLGGVAVTNLPRINRPPDTATLGARVQTTLEAAHITALAERSAVTLSGDGETLRVTGPGGQDSDVFRGAALSGAVSITPDGQSAGFVKVSGGEQPCVRLSLNAGGFGVASACAGSAGSVLTPASVGSSSDARGGSR